jgi:toxin ParE1/3/4
MAEFRLTPSAERDIESIWAHTRRQWGADQANRYTDLLIKSFSELAQLPEAAPACDHIRPGYRHRSLGRHIISFRIAAYGVAIIRILHERMDAPRHL